MADQGPKVLPDETSITRTVAALSRRNIDATVVGTSAEALEQLIELVPSGAELFPGTSETLDSIGYTRYVRQNPRYINLRDKLEVEPAPEKQRELRRLSTVAEYFVGSVQAIAESGEVLVASSSGSQIGAYAFGAKHVILVAGTQKICPSLSDAIARVRGYTLEKHDQWLAKRGINPAPIGKFMILEKEAAVGRVRMVLIKEDLGW